jgi:hypothetical protein
MILITGCCKSGTKYIAKVANLLGLAIGYERVGKDGIVSWKAAIPSTARRLCNTPVAILHQVRHPLLTIQSCLTLPAEAWQYIYSYTSANIAYSALENAMRFWLDWNLIVESEADWTYQIEDLPHNFAYFCEVVGAECDPSVLNDIFIPAQDAQLDWPQLREENEEVYFEIVNMARRYKYGTP